MKKFILISFTILLSSLSLEAQHVCGTVSNHKKIIQDHPKLKKELEKIDFIFNHSDYNNVLLRQENDEPLIIPVVFHVIYENEEDNISLDQIKDQMRIINEDFGRLNPDTVHTPFVFANYAGDTKIQFRLARKDPDGNCTQGVTRTYSHMAYAANDDTKKLIQWDPKKYLNIWVVNNIGIEIELDKEGYILGYAQFPNLLQTRPEKDGIVLRSDRCGSIERASGYKGRTLTHEIGHWLNLIHVWGDEECGNDYVNDTPAAKEANYAPCTGDFPWRRGVCSKTPGQEITQDSGEMFMNYMDYSGDQCVNMFSLGQGARMRAAINAYRSVIVSEENLLATGTHDSSETIACSPIAEFKATNNNSCTGEEVEYLNKSYNAPLDNQTTYQWTFEGGTPSQSTEQNPKVIYEEAGVFKTTLKVTNQAGDGQLTKENYVRVSKANDGMPAPYIQEFESAEFPSFDDIKQNWFVSSSQDASWTVTNEYSSPLRESYARSCMKIRSRMFNVPGERHVLISPNIDLSGTQAPIRAYFDIAHAKRNGNSKDNLVVYVSDDCGENWVKKFDKNTKDLNTFGEGNVYVNYEPRSEDWKQFNINLNSYAGSENLLLKFEFSGKEGNWLYLDNFVVCNSNELGLRSNAYSDLKVYPNPSKGDVTLEFDLHRDAEIEFTVNNLYGAVLAYEKRNFKTSVNRVSLKELYPNLSSGVYFIQLMSNGVKRTEKVIITK